MIRLGYALGLLLATGIGGYLATGYEKYQAKAYPEAVAAFDSLIKLMPTEADRLRFNMAQAHFWADSLAAANELFQQVAPRLKGPEKGYAYNNWGIMAAHQSKLDDAIERFKQALIADPTNEDARFNYELAVRQKQQQPPPPPPPPKPEQDNQKQPSPPQSGDEKQQPPPNQQQQQQQEMDPKVAEQILESMKNKEKQFLQQLKKSVGNKQNQSSNW